MLVEELNLQKTCIILPSAKIKLYLKLLVAGIFRSTRA